MHVLTLVHGTWGRGVLNRSGDAPWTGDSSALCRSLRDRFGKDVIFRRFRWSGSNSHTGRVKAAEELREYLQEGLGSWPDATHVVIAHSHGGNVALSAIETSDLQEKLAGVACLATPFISARGRDIGENPTRTFAAAILVLVLMLLWLLDKLVPAAWGDLGRLSFAVLVGSLLMSVFLLLIRSARKHAERLRRELTPVLPRKDQLLIIRSPADEASGALAVFQFISQVTVRLFLLTRSWVARFEGMVTTWLSYRRKVLLVGVGAFVMCIAFLLGYAALSTRGASSWLVNGALAGWGASFLVFAAAIYLVVPFIGVEGVTLPFRLAMSALLWPVIALLSVVLLAPFGWQAAVANLFLDVTAETTPVGTWQVHLIEPPTSEELGVPVPPLMHMVYENPHVIKKLGEWIHQCRLQHLKILE